MPDRYSEGGEIDFFYTNSLSRTQQRAAGFVAAATDVRPLLVIAHFAGGTRFTARELGYYAECRRRRWHCVCPQLHGEKMSDRGAFGSLESQHDILDAVAYMCSRYPVDPARIYLSGRSMGGLTALLMAAKHPDLFAAVVAGQAITNLETWHAASSQYKEFIEQIACGGPYCERTAFEYARRSAVNYGPNFRYTPLVLWHGTRDTTVPPAEARTIRKAIATSTGVRVPVRWLPGGGHEGCGPSTRWICNQLAVHRNRWVDARRAPGHVPLLLDLVTDEDKEFFWLGVERCCPNALARTRVVLRNRTLVVQCAINVRRLTVRCDRLGKIPRPAQWRNHAGEMLALTMVGEGWCREWTLEQGGRGRIQER